MNLAGQGLGVLSPYRLVLMTGGEMPGQSLAVSKIAYESAKSHNTKALKHFVDSSKKGGQVGRSCIQTASRAGSLNVRKQSTFYPSISS
jgi:hypothetical protein